MIEVTEAELRLLGRWRARKAARSGPARSSAADMLAGIGPLPPAPRLRDCDGNELR